MYNDPIGNYIQSHKRLAEMTAQRMINRVMQTMHTKDRIPTFIHVNGMLLNKEEIFNHNPKQIGFIQQ